MAAAKLSSAEDELVDSLIDDWQNAEPPTVVPRPKKQVVSPVEYNYVSPAMPGRKLAAFASPSRSRPASRQGHPESRKPFAEYAGTDDELFQQNQPRALMSPPTVTVQMMQQQPRGSPSRSATSTGFHAPPCRPTTPGNSHPSSRASTPSGGMRVSALGTENIIGPERPSSRSSEPADTVIYRAPTSTQAFRLTKKKDKVKKVPLPMELAGQSPHSPEWNSEEAAEFARETMKHVGVSDGHSWCTDEQIAPNSLSQLWWQETVFPKLFPGSIPGGREWTMLHESITNSLKQALQDKTASLQSSIEKIYQLAFHEIYRRLPLFQGAVMSSAKKVAELEAELAALRSSKVSNRVQKLEQQVGELSISVEVWRKRALEAEQALRLQEEKDKQRDARQERYLSENKKQEDALRRQAFTYEQAREKAEQDMEAMKAQHASEMESRIALITEDVHRDTTEKLMQMQEQNMAETTKLTMKLQLAESRAAQKAADLFKQSVGIYTTGKKEDKEPMNAEKRAEQAVGMMSKLMSKKKGLNFR